jgi:hypothetical protein
MTILIPLKRGLESYLDFANTGRRQSLLDANFFASLAADSQPESSDAHFLVAHILHNLPKRPSAHLERLANYHLGLANRWKSNSASPEILEEYSLQSPIAPVKFLPRPRVRQLLSDRPDAIFYDVSTNAPLARDFPEVQSLSQLSPFQQIGNVPIPGLEEKFSDTVEGVWQGLKLIRGRIDPSYFKGKGRKRYGRVEGHLFHGKKIGYLEARKKIYVPAYLSMLARPDYKEVIGMMRQNSLKGKEQFVFDVDSNPNISDSRSPIAHSSILAEYVNQLVRDI